MANTVFQTRVQNKFDTLANWTANPDVVLLKGEIAICEVPAVDPVQTAVNGDLNRPQYLMKVGDGVKTFAQLPWLSAVAADVYSWAKAANKPEYDASEIKNLNSYISGQIQDTDTQYMIELDKDDASKIRLLSKTKGASSFTTEVASITVQKYTLAEGSANGTVAFNGVDVPVHGLGSAAYTEATAYATTEQGALADSAMQSVNVMGYALDKNSGVLSVDDAKTALGLKSAAYVDATAFDTNGAAAQALTDAKAYADGLDDAMDTRVLALEAKFGDGEGNVESQISAAIAQEVKDRDAAIKVETDRATAAEKAITDSIGVVTEGKTVVQMISDAQSAATYDDAEVRGLIKDNKDALDVLNGSGDGSVKKAVDDAINKFATDVTDDAVINSYKELIDWVATHGPEAAEMAGEIDALQAILAGIGNTSNGEKATVKAYVDDAISALKIGDYAKVADLTALANRVAAMEAKVANWDAAEQNAKDYADGLNTTMDDRVKVLEAIDHNAYKAYADQAETDAIAAAKAYADGLAGNYDAAGAAAAVDAKLTAEVERATNAEAKALADAKADTDTKLANYTDTQGMNTAIKTAIDDLDSSVAASAVDAGQASVLTGVTQTDGKLTGKTEIKLAKVATSGLIDDLTQVNYMIFNCGSATEVV